MRHAFDRYVKGSDDVAALFFPHRLRTICSEAGSGVHVTVTDPNAALMHGVDESYVLNIDAAGLATLVAPTVWGALHGLETLSQLMRFSSQPEQYFMAQLPVKIEDKPRFPHRGLLVDTGRHFQPVASLKAIINSLSYAKLNIFHWHISEDQSFPFPSDVFPDLPEKGEWSADERYSAGDVMEIVKYAWLRGVRIVPEFDCPGHSSSWRNAIPDIFSAGCKEGKGAFSPFKNKTYEVLAKVLQEWTKLYFTDSFMHIGGDEVPTECWSNEEDQSAQRQLGVQNAFDYFLKKVADINTGLNKQTIMWDEGFVSSEPDPAKVIIQVWRSASTCRDAVEKGFRIIRSQGWYLDHLNENFDQMYAVNPLEGITNPDLHKLVLGGEGCMWGEHVDGSNVLDTIWPRLAAIAERLWIGPNSQSALLESVGHGHDGSDMQMTHKRIATFRCKLLQRGIQAAPSLGRGRGGIPNTIYLPGGDNSLGSCYYLGTQVSDD